MGITAANAILNEAWAIQPVALETMFAIAMREHEYADGNLQALEQKLGRPLDNTQAAYVRDGVAVIPVTGPMFRHANIFTRISGATSYSTLATDIQAAADNPSVNHIVLKIDSPGGAVNGASQLAQYIKDTSKPVTAFIDGTGASAAYWLASAADTIIASDTAMVGSIGVQMGLTIPTEPKGVKSLRFVSSQSPLKNADPESDAGAASLQKTVDDLASVFIESVARNRGITAETVIQNYGQGDVFVAQDALNRGMIDGVNTFEGLISSLQSGVSPMDFSKLTAADLRANRADLVAEIEAGVQVPDVSAAVAAERQRIAAIQAAGMPGTEDVAAACINDGTSAGDAALKIIEAAKKIPAVGTSLVSGEPLKTILATEAGHVAPTAGRADDKPADDLAAAVAAARSAGVVR